jgi:hypothetical protein
VVKIKFNAFLYWAKISNSTRPIQSTQRSTEKVEMIHTGHDKKSDQIKALKLISRTREKSGQHSQKISDNIMRILLIFSSLYLARAGGLQRVTDIDLCVKNNSDEHRISENEFYFANFIKFFEQKVKEMCQQNKRNYITSSNPNTLTTIQTSIPTH